MKKFLISFFLGAMILLLACNNDQRPIHDEVLYVRRDGADMPVYVHGNYLEKVYVLVLHGAGSYGLAFRDGAFTSELEQKFVMVYHDQRGQSMSQGHYSKPEDLVSQMAEDVIAVVQVLKDRYGDDIKVFLMGHSWGGALSGAVLTTGDQQQLFKGWINVDGAHDIPFTGTSRKGFLREIAQEQISKGQLVSDWESLIAGISPLDSSSSEDYTELLQYARTATNLLLEAGEVESSLSNEKLRRALIENNPITYYISNLFNQPFAEARDMEFSVTDQLGQVRIPALLLWGKYDVSVPPAVGKLALDKLGSMDKRLVIFEKSLHHPQDTEPSLFANEVINFIEKNK